MWYYIRGTALAQVQCINMIIDSVYVASIHRCHLFVPGEAVNCSTENTVSPPNGTFLVSVIRASGKGLFTPSECGSESEKEQRTNEKRRKVLSLLSLPLSLGVNEPRS